MGIMSHVVSLNVEHELTRKCGEIIRSKLEYMNKCVVIRTI